MMTELTCELEALRGRFFTSRCPLRTVTQTVFHGSPLSGMVDILRSEKLIPQGHAELPDSEWLSVSVNDNVLRLFSDDELHICGFASNPTLEVRHLDGFHCACATGRSGCKLVEDDEVMWASRLGYVDKRNEYEMQDYELRWLIKPHDGLVFPWTKWCSWMGLHFNQWNEEAEIALNDEGCNKVWQAMSVIYVDGKEYEDITEGWLAVIKAAVKRDILMPAEAKELARTAKRLRNNELQIAC